MHWQGEPPRSPRCLEQPTLLKQLVSHAHAFCQAMCLQINHSSLDLLAYNNELLAASLVMRVWDNGNKCLLVQNQPWRLWCGKFPYEDVKNEDHHWLPASFLYCSLSTKAGAAGVSTALICQIQNSLKMWSEKLSLTYCIYPVRITSLPTNLTVLAVAGSSLLPLVCLGWVNLWNSVHWEVSIRSTRVYMWSLLEEVC